MQSRQSSTYPAVQRHVDYAAPRKVAEALDVGMSDVVRACVVALAVALTILVVAALVVIHSPALAVEVAHARN